MKRFLRVITISALIVFPALSLAQEAPPPASPVETAPVSVPEPSAKALRLYWTGNVLWVIDHVWSLAVPAVVLATGLSVHMRNVASRAGRSWLFPTAAVFTALYVVLTAIIDLPLDFYQGFIRPHSYGLSNQTFPRWLEHHMIGLGVSLFVSMFVMGAAYVVIVRAPKRWWLYLALLSLPLTIFGTAVWPVIVDPLSNKFGPMRDHVLEARILHLAERVGVEGARVYEVDKGRDTTTVNAYVTGLFGSKRIVLWDTLTNKLPPNQVQFVMAHELGHYALSHVPQGLAVSTALLFVSLFFVQKLAESATRRWGPRFGFMTLADVAAGPLILICAQIVGLVAMPAGYAFSRHIEHEADRFALELTHANHDGALSFAAMQQENLSNPRPGPVYRFVRSTHPSLADRIEFCNEYHPWRESQPSKYADYFSKERATGLR